jgi:hypothetical protein
VAGPPQRQASTGLLLSMSHRFGKSVRPWLAAGSNIPPIKDAWTPKLSYHPSDVPEVHMYLGSSLIKSKIRPFHILGGVPKL